MEIKFRCPSDLEGDSKIVDDTVVIHPKFYAKTQEQTCMYVDVVGASGATQKFVIRVRGSTGELVARPVDKAMQPVVTRFDKIVGKGKVSDATTRRAVPGTSGTGTGSDATERLATS